MGVVEGFSCKNLSGLNRGAHLTKLLNASTSTGKTLRGVFQYTQKHSPRYLVLENVRGLLAHSRVNMLLSKFDSMGYDGDYVRVNSKEFMVPQSRHRVYIFLRRRSGEKQPIKAGNMLKRFRCKEPIPIQKVIARRGGRGPRKSHSSRGEKWIEIHDKFSKTHGLKGLRTQAERLAAIEKSYINGFQIPLRMKCAALLSLEYWKVVKEIDVDTTNVLLQIDQEVFRMPGQVEICPCVVPKGVYLMSAWRKLLSGRDMAALQGVSLADLIAHNLDKVEDNMLSDLAGNAFSAPVCCFATLAAICDFDG